ncbi:MAG TPA: APC family permease [Actinomycetota bacterium]|nr:APC family permease [Actinomycetota bacterium]
MATEGDRKVEYERLGGKKLSLIDVLAQSVGFMGPVFSAAFIIPLIIGFNFSGRGAGISTPLAVLLAGMGTFALGWIVAQYAKRIHAAGSLYDYVSAGLGRTVGAAAGWLYYGGTIILTTGLGLLIGGYVHDNLWPVLFEAESPLPIWLWDVIFAALLFVVLYFGVQISTRVQLTLALISIAVLLIFFITVIVELGSDNDFAKVFDPTPEGGLSGILFGVLYGILIFVGFETAANLAEETADPKRSIPRAVLGAVVIVGVFYLIASYVEIAGFGFDLAVITDPAVASAPVFALGDPSSPYGSEFWLKILLLVVFLDMLAVYVGAAVASTRGVFALARDRRLPAMAAGVSPKYGTPVGAIVLLMVVQGVLILVSEANDTLLALPGFPHYYSVFVWCATFGGFALLVVYLLMSVGAFKGLSDDPNKVGLVISAIVGIAITAAGIWGSFYKVPSPTLLAPWSAVIWFALGLVYMAAVKGREPASDVLEDLRA